MIVLASGLSRCSGPWWRESFWTTQGATSWTSRRRLSSGSLSAAGHRPQRPSRSGAPGVSPPQRATWAAAVGSLSITEGTRRGRPSEHSWLPTMIGGHATRQRTDHQRKGDHTRLRQAVTHVSRTSRIVSRRWLPSPTFTAVAIFIRASTRIRQIVAKAALCRAAQKRLSGAEEGRPDAGPRRQYQVSPIDNGRP